MYTTNSATATDAMASDVCSNQLMSKLPIAMRKSRN